MSDATTASFEYLQWQPLFEKQKPYEVFIPRASFGNRQDIPRSNLAFETREVPIRDIRGSEDSFKLDIHGFEIVKHATGVENLKIREAVLGKYIAEMEAFLKAHLGDEGLRTFCFDHRVCSPALSLLIVHVFCWVGNVNSNY